MNIDVGWSMSLDSDWKLFGGEINYEFDSVALDADSLEEVGWQTVEDDVLSVCSSVTSWSCLHGNNLLETNLEMYGDPCKGDDYDKFDGLLPDELIVDMNGDLPVSLEQFYKINRLIDAEVKIESTNPAHLLLNQEVIGFDVIGVDDCEAEKLESFNSDAVNIGKMSDDVATLLFTDDSVTSPHSPCFEVASLECEEELYEESVIDEDVPSTISCEELQDLMEGNCDKSVLDFELVQDVETLVGAWCRRPTELTNCRRLRKKEQNKSAALRYRLKKRSEQGLVLTEYALLERRNIELKTRLDAMTKEISYLKSLIDELCP